MTGVVSLFGMQLTEQLLDLFLLCSKVVVFANFTEETKTVSVCVSVFPLPAISQKPVKQ